jgi:hypothetical protein
VEAFRKKLVPNFLKYPGAPELVATSIGYKEIFYKARSPLLLFVQARSLGLSVRR